MASVTKIRTFTAIQDERIVLQNSQYSRPFNIPVWTTLRIALRVNMRNTGIDIITPAFYVGLSSGSSNMIMDPLTTHWCGVKSSGNWTYFLAGGGSPTQYYGLGLKATKRVQAVTSENATPIIGTVSCIPADETIAVRSLFFVDITRVGYPGSGSYIIDVPLVYSSSATDSDDASVNDFKTQAAATIPVQSSHASGASKTLTVDEGTDGVFNHINIGWDQAIPQIEISDNSPFKIA